MEIVEDNETEGVGEGEGEGPPSREEGGTFLGRDGER